MKTIETEVPEQLYREAMLLVKEGWFRNENGLFLEAIRRFLESHQPELMEQFVHEDIEWGLHGKD